MTKNFGFVEAKVNNSSLNVKNLLYKLIKMKQYTKYWELMEKFCNVKNLSPKFKNLYLKMVAYNPDERSNKLEKINSWLILSMKVKNRSMF